MAEQLRERERETRRREIYRQSVLAASERRADISERHLDIAEQRERRLSEPSPREQIDEMFLGQLQDLPPERIKEIAQRRYMGSPRTTLQVDDLQDVIGADFDSWQMNQPGGVTETEDVWGESQQALSGDFTPDPTQIDQIIDDISVTYSDITGLPRESLKNLAQRQARNRWRNYRGGAMFQLVPSLPSDKPGETRTEMFAPAQPSAKRETGLLQSMFGPQAEKRWIPDDTRYYVEPPGMEGKIGNWTQLSEGIKKKIWTRPYLQQTIRMWIDRDIPPDKIQKMMELLDGGIPAETIMQYKDLKQYFPR
jgi:hypothetical protein